MPAAYLRRTYLLRADLEELVTAELWRRGTLGIEVQREEAGSLRFEAYFPAGPAAGGSPGEGDPSGARLLREETLPEADWLAPFRASALPFAVGRRLWVDPREPDSAPEPAPDGRALLRLPARRAFGIGSHESTRLLLQMLEEIDLAGLRVLDLGTGTGILAFAALLAGARLAVGLDLDPLAVFQARENALLNRLRLPLLAGGLGALAGAARRGSGAPPFDLALVNVVPGEIAADLPLLPPLLAPGGEALFSGILWEHREAALRALEEVGLRPLAGLREGEWIAFRTAR